MPITFLRYFPRFEIEFIDLCPNKDIVIFDPVMERFKTDLFDRCRDLEPSFRNKNYFIIRGRTKAFKKTILEFKKNDIKKIIPSKNIISLIGSLRKGCMPELNNILTEAHPRIRIDDLRQAEILSIIERGGSLYNPKNKNYHFNLPSKLHANRFIRLADGLHDPVEVSRIVDWVMPYLNKHTTIVADTGSILTLLYAIKSEVLKHFNIDVSLRTIDEYPPKMDYLMQVFRDAKSKSDKNDGNLLFLLSVNSSGNFLKILTGVIDKEKDTSVVIICNTTKDEKKQYDSLLNFPIEKYEAVDGECDLCPSSILISINPKTYQIQPDIKYNKKTLTYDIVSKQKVFWENVDETSALSINVKRKYYDTSGTRLFSFYIDICKLYQSKWFKKLVDVKIKKLYKPDIVFIPSHENSKFVHDVIKKIYPDVNVFIVSPDKIKSAHKKDILNLEQDSVVLIADDALVTNKTLMNYRPPIYEVAQSKGIDVGFQVFVMISRPSKKSQIIDLKKRYKNNISASEVFSFGHEVYLPEPGKSTWKSEENFLRDTILIKNNKINNYISARIGEIKSDVSNVVIGMNDSDSNIKTMGSYFGELSSKAGFAAATSVCCLLDDEYFRGEEHWQSEINVIDLSTLINNYFDSCFLAAALRYFNTKSYIGEKDDSSVANAINNIDPNCACSGSIEEIGWAAVNRILPSAPVLELLNKVTIKNDCHAYLIYILKQYTS